jgi:hypothetical protein
MFTPLFYNIEDTSCYFIYFTGYGYEIVSCENYSGMFDFLRCSPAKECVDIYSKKQELNAPILESKEKYANIKKAIQDLDYYPDHVLTYQIDKTTGFYIPEWTSDASEKLKKIILF